MAGFVETVEELDWNSKTELMSRLTNQFAGH